MTSPNIWTPGGKPFANVNNSVEVQHITPTAGQQDFTITNFTYAPYTNSIQVYLNGVLQRSGTDYLETSESSIRFLSANLTSSDTLSLIGMSEFIPTVSADLVSSQQIIVSAPTSILSIGSASYVPFRSGLQVYVNGVLMYPGRDYIEITGSRIEFTQPLATDDEVLIRFGVNSEISGDAAGISYILPGGVVRDVAGKLGEFVSVKDFGAKLNGVDDDATATNTAIAYASANGIGEVRFSGVLGIASGLIARTGVTLVGDGWATSKIKTLAGFTGNIYETYDFAALQMAQTASTSAGCPVSYGIENCTIDGENYSGTVTADTGYGVRLYGRQLRLKNLIIGKTAGIGLYTEFPSSPSYVSFDSLTDTKYSTIQNIEVMETGYEGFVFFGPTDQYLDNIFVGWPAGSRFDTYDTTGPKTSLLFPGEPIHGVRLQRTVEIGFLHSYDNEYGRAVWISPKAGDPHIRLRANYLMGESSYGGVYIGANVRYQISLLETHTNRRGPTVSGPYTGSAGANPHVEILSTLGGGAKIDVYREENERGSSGVVLSGTDHDVEAQVFSYAASFTGGGTGFVNSATSSRIDADIVSKNDSNRLTVGYEEASTTSANIVDARAKFCATNISFLGGAGSDTGNKFTIYSDRAGTTGINNIARLGAMPYLQSDIYDFDGTNRRRNKWYGSIAVNFAITGLQTLSIPYGTALIRDPLESEIQLTVSYDTGTFPPITKIGVSNIDTANKEIDVFIECTGGAAGTGKINARVG